MDTIDPVPPPGSLEADSPEPVPEALVDELLHLLDVQPNGPDVWQGRRQPGGVGRIFGGQVIAQALVAAERSVPEDRPVHSLHAYFLRGGDENHPIDFRVERDLDGGSFSNRRVVASQNGKPILTLIASFHRREAGAFHADGMPDVPPPEALRPEAELRREFANSNGLNEARRRAVLRPRPIEMRPVEGRHWLSIESQEPLARTWFRCCAPLPDDPRVHSAILAYASDMTLLSASTLPHGLSWARGTVMGVSLDHAVWFHEPCRADEWLLYVCDSPWAGHARGFNRGRIYTRDGRLVAETAQEGLIRPITQKA